MTRRQEILKQAAEKINGKDFRIQGLMLDVNDDDNPQNVTCLTWENLDEGIPMSFIAIDMIDMVGIN